MTTDTVLTDDEKLDYWRFTRGDPPSFARAIDLWNVESVGMAKAYTNMQKAIRALLPPL